MDCFTEDFEELDDTDGDECGGQLDRLLVPRLPVATFNSYDPTLPPVTGEEYLRRVQLEARKCPEVVVADIDVNRFASNQTLVIEDTNGFVRATPDVMPSLEWQRDQVSEFSKVRLKVSKMCDKRRLTAAGGKISTDDRPLVRHRAMNWWREYCTGKRSDHSSESDSDSVCEEESDVSSTPTDTPNTSATFKSHKSRKPEPNLPLMSVICALTQDEVIILLSFFVKWCQRYRFTEHFGLWIYALLAALDKPLPAEVYSTLRDLSRVCSQCRHRIQLPPDSNIMIALNLIICIIGRYYDQNDLCDQ